MRIFLNKYRFPLHKRYMKYIPYLVFIYINLSDDLSIFPTLYLNIVLYKYIGLGGGGRERDVMHFFREQTRAAGL